LATGNKNKEMTLLLLRSIKPNNWCMLRQMSAYRHVRYYANDQTSKKSGSLAKSESRSDVGEAKPIRERVKETAKTTSYLGVILLGVGVTGIMFYAIFNELFSSNSPQAIYSDAFEKCKDDQRVQDALGQPIKGFGEESRRRRRNHVAHQIFQNPNTFKSHMRLNFHIQGIRNKATVHCEMREVIIYMISTRFFFLSTN
jgi:import inner membrane translocase subunit TIM21